MKKLFIFIMCTIMLLTTAAAVSAGRRIQGSDTMLDFLEHIGIINTETDAAEDVVTREIFAVYVARMLGIDETAEAKTRYFRDVENNAFSAKAINTLAENGIIAVPEDRYFRPGETVSYDEAVKMLVCAAGYGTYASYRGGYPKGYLDIARRLDIECTVKDRSSIKVIEAAELIYKTLVAPVADGTDTIGGFETENSMLNTYFDILWQEGTVLSIAGKSVKSEGALPFDKAEIGSHIYDVSPSLDAGEYLGGYVWFFYKSDGDSEEIIYISDEIKRTEDVVISIDLFDTFSGDVISYYKDYQSSAKLTERLVNPVIVYNGIYLGEDVNNTLKSLNKGTVTVKDSNNDGSYDTVLIKDYKNFIVSAADTDSKRLFNKLSGEPEEICLDDFDSCCIFNDIGNKIAFDEIRKGSVASVAMSKDGRSYVEVIVSGTEFNGTVTGIESDERYSYVAIEQKEYMIDKSYLDEFCAFVETGNVYYFKTDMLGKIAYVHTADTKTFSMGYVRKTGYDTEQDKCYISMLNEECAVATVLFGDKVRIDGQRYRDADEMKAALELALGVGDTSIKDRFVCYSLNDDGYVAEIDTLSMNNAYENNKNSMTAVYAKDTTEKVFSNSGAPGTTSRNFGRAALVNPDTTVFFLPGDNDLPEPDKCYVGKYSNILKENIRYTGNAYKLSEMSTFADAILVRYEPADLDGNTNGTKYAFLIDKISKGLSSEEELVWFVSGYENGVKKTLEAPIDVNLAGLKRGDVVRFEYDLRKMISENGVAENLYDSDDPYPSWGINPETGCRLKESASYTNMFQASFGNVVKVSGSCVFWAAEGYTDIVDSADVGAMNIVVYDSAEGTVSQGTVNDIYDAESRGTKCSRIMYVTRDNIGRGLYIFN